VKVFTSFYAATLEKSLQMCYNVSIKRRTQNPMTKFAQALADAKTAQLRDSNGKVNQSDRNALRAILMAALTEDLNAVMTSEGAVVGFEHEYWGQLFVEVPLKMKDADFDVETAQQEYADKVEKAESREQEKLAKARERDAKAAALKEAREKKGA
jgi:RecA-family ATPase